MASGVPLRFDVYEGGSLVRSEELHQDMIKVGKLSSSHLRIDDAAVSRMHAVIESTGDTEAHVIDLGSARGTVVNGERVNKHKLCTGDRIELGNTTLVVWVGSADIERARSGAAPVAAGGDAAGGGPGAAAVGQAAARAPSKPRFEVGAVQAYYQQQQQAIDARMAAEGAAMEIDDPRKGYVLEVVELAGDTVHSVRMFRAGEDVRIGDSPKAGAHFIVDTDALGAKLFTLVKGIGNQYALNFTSVMSGEVKVAGGTPQRLDALVDTGEAIAMAGGHQYMLAADARARVNVGGGAFLLRVVPAPKVVALGGSGVLSRAEAGYFGFSIGLHALFLLLAFIVPPEMEGFRLDSFDTSNRFVAIIVTPDKDEEPDVPDWFNEMKERKEKKKQAARSKGDEGKMGKKDAKDKDKKLAVKGPKDNQDLQIRREQIREKVKNVGALQALGGGMSSALFGSDQTLGSDAISAMGGWSGKTVGVSRGYGGFGAVGMGRGGGGVSESSIGLGSIGTRGRGGGKKGFGRGVGNLGERAGRVPKVIAGRAIVTGALDKQIIRRVINKARQGIKACYERQLQKNRDLHGKIVVKFVIAPSGRVLKASIRESTMGNKKVENCIVGRVKRFKFPAPKGGGIVEVSYPFIFKAT